MSFLFLWFLRTDSSQSLVQWLKYQGKSHGPYALKKQEHRIQGNHAHWSTHPRKEGLERKDRTFCP